MIAPPSTVAALGLAAAARVDRSLDVGGSSVDRDGGAVGSSEGGDGAHSEKW